MHCDVQIYSWTITTTTSGHVPSPLPFACCAFHSYQWKRSLQAPQASSSGNRGNHLQTGGTISLCLALPSSKVLPSGSFSESKGSNSMRWRKYHVSDKTIKSNMESKSDDARKTTTIFIFFRASSRLAAAYRTSVGGGNRGTLEVWSKPAWEAVQKPKKH